VIIYIIVFICLNSVCVMPLKRNRCGQVGCTNRVVVLVGDCTYCKGKFCSTHRLPEAHNCIEIGLCKSIALDRNTELLFACKCVGSKI